MEPIERIADVGRTLDALGIPWVLGGSMASSLVGEPRSTLDIDLAVRMELSHVRPFFEAVRDRYYVSFSGIARAVSQHDSFNLLPNDDPTKVDIFVLGESVLDRNQISRREPIEVGGTTVWVGTAEDQILRKLWWFDQGGRVSDHQWRDVLGILQVQAGAIDLDYLRATAEEARLSDLVESAVAEAQP
jgi:hypothetical protein